MNSFNSKKVDSNDVRLLTKEKILKLLIKNKLLKDLKDK